MNSRSRNFIIFYLMAAILGVFVFHWFFIDNMMPATECFSINCIYSSPQTTQPKDFYNFLATLILIIIASLPITLWLNNEFKKILGRMLLGRKIDGFWRKLISWLKILKKRDPRTVLAVARIFDFRQ